MVGPRINVLFIVNSLCFGGAEKHVVTLANRLDTNRFRLSLAYLKNDAALMPQVDAARIEAGVFCCNVERKIDRAVIRRLARHLVRERIDVVVCVNTYSLMYGQLARLTARSGSRIVELFHSTELDGFKEQLQMQFYRPFFRCADLLVYVCHHQRRYWRARLLRARADTVVCNGVDTSYFHDRHDARERSRLRRLHGFADDGCVLGLCAAMRPEKAHGDLLQALARLRDSGLVVNCLLIGDGPQRTQIEAMIDALGLRRQVAITGFQQDVRPMIAACDAMVLVSHHVETFSIAALEAMSMGKPMIMSDIGGAAEQVIQGENGYRFPRGDIEALVGAIRRLADPAHARALGARARAVTVRAFSLPAMVASYDDLFAGLAAARPVERANRRAA